MYKRFSFWRFDVSFSWQSRNPFLGRFGGGWNWKVGFQAGGNTIFFNLLVAELSISFLKAENDHKS